MLVYSQLTVADWTISAAWNVSNNVNNDDERAPQRIFPASDSSSQWHWSPQRRSFCSEKKTLLNSPVCQRPRAQNTWGLSTYLWRPAVVHHVPDHVPKPGQVGRSYTLHLGGDGAHHQVKRLVPLVPQQHDATKIKHMIQVSLLRERGSTSESCWIMSSMQIESVRIAIFKWHDRVKVRLSCRNSCFLYQLTYREKPLSSVLTSPNAFCPKAKRYSGLWWRSKASHLWFIDSLTVAVYQLFN